jgi:membrane fusion protein (multidrug efflux system)
MKYGKLSTVLPLLVVACGSDTQAEQLNTTLPIVGRLVEVQEIPTTIPIHGAVRARRRAEIATRMMARVSDVLVDVGASVHAGQILAVLGRDDLAASRAQAEAAVEAAEAMRDEAQRQLDRMETLLEQDAVPLVQRDGARLALVQAQSAYAAARAGLAGVESQASYSELAAPFGGRVVQRFAEPGNVANPGVPLLVIEDMVREGVVFVPVDVAMSLTIGTPVSINSGRDRTTSAPITRIASGADPTTRTVEVRFDLPNFWPTGANITALVPQGTHSGVAIEADMVVRRGQLTGVRIATDRGTRLRWIRLGRTFVGPDEKLQFEVLSGLTAGETIAE